MAKKIEKKQSTVKNQPAQIWAKAIGPEALEVCEKVRVAWQKRELKKDGDEESYTIDSVLDEALTLGLHFVAIRDIGDPDAWCDQTTVSSGAPPAAISTSGAISESLVWAASR